MNAIVSLYKTLVLVFLFVVLVVGAFAFLMVATNANLTMADRLPAFAIIGAVTLGMFLMVSGLALVISMHDRHNEIAEGVHRIASALERQAGDRT